MLMKIKENWEILTIFGGILVMGFSAGIWFKGSLDALKTLPGQVEKLEGRLKPIEKIPDDIKELSKKSNDNYLRVKANVAYAKEELKIYIIDMEIDKIQEQINPIMNKDEELTSRENRFLKALQDRQRRLTDERKAAISNRDKQLSFMNK